MFITKGELQTGTVYWTWGWLSDFTEAWSVFITCRLFPVSVETDKYYYNKEKWLCWDIFFRRLPSYKKNPGAAKPVKLRRGEEPRVVADSLFRGPCPPPPPHTSAIWSLILTLESRLGLWPGNDSASEKDKLQHPGCAGCSKSSRNYLDFRIRVFSGLLWTLCLV